ncbi:ABC transporter permease [uncultured Paludibaculum sp.]|uniref:ABC transporter permease n=1 Tax=uncultured Paludibaculum sp. TaxID=1765020 RepID=UPI002AABF64E|nr:ABC transporter permease [uncultured Paludibaculum sp.]
MGLKELWRRLTRSGQADSELDEEMRLHLELRARKLREQGMAAEESDYAARRRFGNVLIHQEDSHDLWAFRWLEELAADVRLAIRTSRKSPAFTLLALVSLTLGLAANTAIFSFVNAIVLKTLPVRDASRLVLLRQNNETFHMENCCFSYNFFQGIRKQNTGFEDFLAVANIERDVVDGDRRTPVSAELVSGNYFAMLGLRPAMGRLLDDSDDRVEKGARVCVISDRLWRTFFNGAPDVVGRKLVLDKEPFQIVGVAPAGFQGATLHGRVDLQIPTAWAEAFYGSARDQFGWLELIGRLKPGVSMQAAGLRLNPVGMRLQREIGFKLNEKDDFILRDGSQGTGSRKEKLGRPVLLLLSIVGLVLVMACANLAALWLVRSIERAREAAIRVALGATRWAVIRQFLVQSLLLSLVSGAVGWLLSQFFITALLSLMGPERDSLTQHVKPDPMVLAFFTAVTLGSGLLFGLLPALRAWTTDPMPLVQTGTLFAAGKRALGYRYLISAQIAVSVALVFTAGLLAQTLHNLRAIDLGFQPQHVVLANVDFERLNYSEAGAAQAMRNLLTRAQALPGAQSASVATINILTGSMASFVLRIPGYVGSKGMPPVAYYTSVSPGYFRTMGIPFRRGRDFAMEDRTAGESPVIVNEQFAKRYLGGDGVGKPLAYGGGRKVRVVGVVGTSKYRWLREDPEPIVYLPATADSMPGSAWVQVRSTASPELVETQLRALIQAADSRLPVDKLTTMDAQIDESLAAERLLALLSTALGLLAVGLAAIGLYGVLSYSTARRTREIGIRVAIGADRGSILGMVLGESAWMVAAGLVAGLPLALFAGRLIQSQLYGLKPADLVTTVLAGLFLMVISAAAALLPAWRATRVDPASCLRYE